MESRVSLFIKIRRSVLCAALTLALLSGSMPDDIQQGKVSAAKEIEQIIAKSGLDAAVARFIQMRTTEKERFTFDSKDFNDLGSPLKDGSLL